MGDYAKIRFKENKSLRPFFEGGARAARLGFSACVGKVFWQRRYLAHPQIFLAINNSAVKICIIKTCISQK